MSIQDALCRYFDDESLTATMSSDVIDFGAGLDAWDAAVAQPELAEGRPLYFNFTVGTALDSAGEAATLVIVLYTGTTTSPATAVYTSATITEAACTAGSVQASFALPLGLKRYSKVTCTVGTEDFTSGTISAWIGLEPLVAK